MSTSTTDAFPVGTRVSFPVVKGDTETVLVGAVVPSPLRTWRLVRLVPGQIVGQTEVEVAAQNLTALPDRPLIGA